jgi:hypothetical protein
LGVAAVGYGSAANWAIALGIAPTANNNDRTPHLMARMVHSPLLVFAPYATEHSAGFQQNTNLIGWI